MEQNRKNAMWDEYFCKAPYVEHISLIQWCSTEQGVSVTHSSLFSLHIAVLFF